MRRTLLLLALAAFAAGCGGSSGPSSQSSSEGAATTQPAQAQMPVVVYVVRDGKLAAERRLVPRTRAVARAALEALGAGEIRSLAIADGTATLDLAPEPSGLALAQVVYTLTEFPTVARVAIGGKTITRTDLEPSGYAPPILIVSPQPGDKIASPVRVLGSADAFEATFVVDITDGADRIVAQKVVTASSGSGERGDFDVSVAFADAKPGHGRIVAFEDSAETGKRIHIVEVPVVFP